jgi:hypothetical protein
VDLVDATVVAAAAVPCRSALPGPNLTCRDVTARLDTGWEKGQRTTLNITDGPDQPTLRGGDRALVGFGVTLLVLVKFVLPAPGR